MNLDDEELRATREANGANRHKGNMEEDIEILQNFINEDWNCKYTLTKVKQSMKNILAGLEKKDRQIIKLKNNNQNLLRKLRNRIKEIKKLTRYALYKKEITTLNKQLQQKNKIIEDIKEEVRDHIGFENRLKRDNREPDMFNQGRFYVANQINDILKRKGR